MVYGDLTVAFIIVWVKEATCSPLTIGALVVSGGRTFRLLGCFFPEIVHQFVHPRQRGAQVRLQMVHVRHRPAGLEAVATAPTCRSTR